MTFTFDYVFNLPDYEPVIAKETGKTAGTRIFREV